MSLRDQLKEILPQILPPESSEAIKGTELIRLVKFQLKQEYSDATLRYHFSILSADPRSPIAKVAQGQGYFLRPSSRSQLESAPSLIGLRQTTFIDDQRAPEEIDRELYHLAKFRAIINRWLLANQRYAFFFDHAYSADARRDTAWNYPEAVAVEWNVAVAGDSSIQLDPSLIERLRLFNAPLFNLTGIKLRIELSLNSYREDFFQALSQSEWTNGTDLIIASPIDDASLAENVSALGQRHGVGVLTFGLSPRDLDALPAAAEISTMSSAEFDAVLSKANIKRLSMPREDGAIQWATITNGKNSSPDVDGLLAWIEHCLTTLRPQTPTEFIAEKALASLA